MAAQTNDCEVEGLARGPGAADSGDRGQRGGDSYQLQEGMFGMAAIKKKEWQPYEPLAALSAGGITSCGHRTGASSLMWGFR